MKKVFLVLMMALMFCACSNAAQQSDDERIQVVTTIFPEFDWVRNIAGDKAADMEITMLLDNGVDLHSYQPTADDVMKISNCDLFIYVGGESDEWVDDALEQAKNKDMIVLDLLDILGDKAKLEEHVEGMEEEHGEEEHEEEEEEYDEHVWLSLNNAAVLCEKIEEALSGIDKENASYYKENLNTYLEKLNGLDKEYKEVLKNAKGDTLVFADRFPFRYLCDDYDLHYYAAFAGCSAETEASFDTVIFLAKKVDELSLKSVMVLEKTDHRIARTIIDNTAGKDHKIIELNSLQSVTSKDVEDGASYFEAMKENLVGIKEALD
ncbi:MAG: metal ABC transporter substrate-binding protein [Erysipelotrichaceae bacterium]|nr:metal ABC transporter substrate-binding protein [Erysipelotrichaceae bacterium]